MNNEQIKDIARLLFIQSCGKLNPEHCQKKAVEWAEFADPVFSATKNFDSIPIRSLGAGFTRIRGALIYDGINTTKQLIGKDERYFLGLRNFGKGSLSQLKALLPEIGLRFNDDLVIEVAP